MLGIISCIISLKKGHKGYAIFIGIWTLIAFILAFMGFSYAVAPGLLFFLISLGQENINDKSKTEKSDIARYMMYCKNCGYIGSAEAGYIGEYKCPNCKTPLFSTGFPRDEYINKAQDYKDKIASEWKTQTKEYPLEHMPRNFYKYQCSACKQTFQDKQESCPYCLGKGTITSRNFNFDEYVAKELISVKPVDYSAQKINAPAVSNAVKNVPVPTPKISEQNTENISQIQHREKPFVYINKPNGKMKTCKNCGKTIDEDSYFCLYCGSAVEGPHEEEKKETLLFCHKCGAKLLEDSVFCSLCGERIPNR